MCSQFSDRWRWPAQLFSANYMITRSCSPYRVGNRYIAPRPSSSSQKIIQSRPSKPTILFMMYRFEGESQGTTLFHRSSAERSARFSVMKHLLLVLLGGLALLCRSIRGRFGGSLKGAREIGQHLSNYHTLSTSYVTPKGVLRRKRFFNVFFHKICRRFPMLCYIQPEGAISSC